MRVAPSPAARGSDLRLTFSTRHHAPAVCHREEVRGVDAARVGDQRPPVRRGDLGKQGGEGFRVAPLAQRVGGQHASVAAEVQGRVTPAALLLQGRGEQRDERMPSMPLAGVEYRF